MPEQTAVVDTVVLYYFALVDRMDVLIGVLGSPILVPRIILDPDEGEGQQELLCEISKTRAFHQRRANDERLRSEDRKQAQANMARIDAIWASEADGTLRVVDMTDHERELFSKLCSTRHLEEFGLVVPLDAGEAACLAIAVDRDCVLVTDDGDALKARATLDSQRPYQRIRKLLRDAGHRELIGCDEANALHREMQELGFWDKELPFPAEGKG